MSRAMTGSDTWFRLFGELIDKHSTSYRDHLLDLLLRREWTIARLCGGIDAVQGELPTVLEPALRIRRTELERARKRLAEREAVEELAVLRTHAHNLEALNRALAQRIEDLHQSWSWRLTSPLRRIFEWLRFR
jgi:hypothetical protein